MYRKGQILGGEDVINNAGGDSIFHHGLKLGRIGRLHHGDAPSMVDGSQPLVPSVALPDSKIRAYHHFSAVKIKTGQG